MNNRLFLFVALFANALLCCHSFYVQQQFWQTPVVSPQYSSSIWPLSAVQLEPEPEGGEEITPMASLPSCRVKKMREATEVKKSDSDEPIYEFWMTAQAEGALINEIRTQVLKDASKKANFPGFRKGQVPPYAQPQITQFAVQESLIKTVENILQAYGLKTISGSDGAMNINENVTDMARGYKIGDSLSFTATIKATFDPEKTRPVVDESVSTSTSPSIIDAVIEEGSASAPASNI